MYWAETGENILPRLHVSFSGPGIDLVPLKLASSEDKIASSMVHSIYTSKGVIMAFCRKKMTLAKTASSVFRSAGHWVQTWVVTNSPITNFELHMVHN